MSNPSSPLRYDVEAALQPPAPRVRVRVKFPDVAGDSSSSEDGDEDDGVGVGIGVHTSPPGIRDDGEVRRRAHPLTADMQDGRERLEWQSMLASVLSGDVLKGEESRQGVNRPDDEAVRRDIASSFWWQIRAKLRGRTEDEERRRVEEKRGRFVDRVLEEIDRFQVKISTHPAGMDRRLSAENANDRKLNGSDEVEKKYDAEMSALDQVTYILEKLSVIETLYPTTVAMRAAKPLYNSPELQLRVDALTAWSTVVAALQSQLKILRRWTGSEELDITKPNTTKERALVAKNRYHPFDARARALSQAASTSGTPGNEQAADDTTFLERLMKEDNLKKTFARRTMVDNLAVIVMAKETVIQHSVVFEELKLPNFEYELVRLIAFPGRLIIEALKVRLDAAGKLVSPSQIVIDDMLINFKLIIGLSVVIKKEYEAIVAPDPANRWVIPHCFPSEYDTILTEGLKTFFKLVHWKLRLGSRTMYFSETAVLEKEWKFMYEAAQGIPGGDTVVAEHFCNLVNKLMVRMGNYFDTQLHVPIPIPPGEKPRKKSIEERFGGEKRPMTTDEMLVWFSKILDAVKMRYRKLQRFARRLSSRFDNSAEYSLPDDVLSPFIDQLQATGHFLVYTQVFEERGTYILADGSLWNKPEAVRNLLSRAFSARILSRSPAAANATSPAPDPNIEEDGPDMGQHSDGEDSDLEECAGAYLLLLSPRQNFGWRGAIMTLPQDYIEFSLEDNRVRLIADGPTTRLQLCKELFQASLEDVDPDQQPVQIDCLVPAQAHLPKIQKELRKIARSTQRLNESIIESAAHVRRALGGTPGTQEEVENWYTFASDHGRRVAVHVPDQAKARFVRLLMRLAISWVSFICDNCDPTDWRTFRWTVNALRYAHTVTGGENILHLDSQEFALLRKSVAALVSFLILHFDVLGARSSMEAKKETDRVEAMRRLQRLQENKDDDFLPRATSPMNGGVKQHMDRSIRISLEQRLNAISELEAKRIHLSTDQHLTGQVLDEQVNEDRALVFLAASSSNIALRWQQGAFIGGGANGNVYIGFNLDSGGIMAVKEIRVQDFSNSPQLYKQIKDESDVMSMLSHPNIVEYYGIEVHRDRVYIFEEYCEGGSLANLLEHGRVEDEEVCMLQALRVVHSIYTIGSMLLALALGAIVIVKGNRTMARTRAPTPNDGMDGFMNSLAGTPMYMAPEVIKNEKSGRLGAMDIWSMGCVLLEIVTGRKPWSNLDNEWAIMFHIGIATQHPPLPDPKEMSQLGIDFIEQCVTLDPAERPTATELLFHPWLASMVQAMVSYHVVLFFFVLFLSSSTPWISSPY
ncbi:hypothetical protein TREMEDRAFT_33972 [Tremella mesenterica DSM 1558]|uniref:uncharacterized protein n=1 Tax=Tremella mesenterica (strain ATCC 24925 / CBS 8224 / DSM 1558 / NBRC 9311 / NRRL Y-6157 / RJB 2259-6 / UBC 559-6) TaxID=578456 RepID=UPI0003F4A4EE|nr:uncharacterized protein TREMEDRAFT_33972 [Tremella mesenterica DSM 1558]EIW67172.1 hypothetical protein TREMEDRAFT_33972 [Tremella mesenterica DSM 1558]